MWKQERPGPRETLAIGRQLLTDVGKIWFTTGLNGGHVGSKKVRRKYLGEYFDASAITQSIKKHLESVALLVPLWCPDGKAKKTQGREGQSAIVAYARRS